MTKLKLTAFTTKHQADTDGADQDGRDRGADDAGDAGRRAVQRHGVPDQIPADHLLDKRLPGRVARRAKGAE
jgi:hypothetical protein